ncbi:MAG: DUF1634 domain-containing protein [Bacteroidetes bacterium]|nr:DUF1634 domain-containing protein [Bacteroidota bacterium]
MALILYKKNDSRLETVMSCIFGLGVIVASLFVIIGIILSHHSHTGLDLLKERSDFIHKSNFFRLVNALIGGRNLPKGPLLFVTLGMVSLVLTPLLAVAASFVYFALTKNLKFAFITLVVMAILITSLAVH